MTATLLALSPVGLVIALGWALKRRGLPGDGFRPHAERLTYYVPMPSLIVGSLARAPVAAVIFAGAPASSSAFILSRQMGGDSALMAQLVAATTVASAVTLPLMLAVQT